MRSIASGLLSLVVLVCLDSGSWAADCASNPEAIGTSRVLTVDPGMQRRIGTVQFEATLPLRDHEVVLSFDDGPSPESTNKILDELAAQCVKATFFILGGMASQSPAILRHVRNEGHSIGTHTQTHPHLARLTFDEARNEIDQGIDSVRSALKDRDTLAPFFRAPYLETTSRIDSYLESRGLMLWGIDVDSDDWMFLTPEAIIARVTARLEKKGRGVVLMHDIQGRTAVALPGLLKELKARGYRIVHVVPPTETFIARVARQSIARIRYVHYRAIVAVTELSRVARAKGIELTRAGYSLFSRPSGKSAASAAPELPEAAKPPAASESTAARDSTTASGSLALDHPTVLASTSIPTPEPTAGAPANRTVTPEESSVPAPEKPSIATPKNAPAPKNPAATCEPNAIGTSRTLAIDWTQFKQIGSVQFPNDLPLKDHELVLTFDDGPMPPYTDKVLDVLAAHCVKATFFVVGSQATDSPDLLRRAKTEGHTIGTMTENHYELAGLTADEAQKEIADGIASSKEALGSASALAPFFRDPYLKTTSAAEAYLMSQRIIFWSSDFDADDWENISPDEVVTRALASIEDKRRGILELHDIQERTVLALPKLLAELKRRGYRIVHVTAKEM
ncbi:MAG: hypothetical protein EPO23_07580 [Xanthobacteraceae bacterium]|nr:MAG: hypothetical protein EPO23_07580 [Xanthobacteraceae bacterium]